jgi:cell shape-determining protein MreC
MKKTFLVKRNALLSPRAVSSGAVALGAVVLLLSVRLIAPDFFWHIFSPLSDAARAVSETGHGFLASFENAASLAAQNEKLAAQNAALADENQTLVQKTATLATLLGTTNVQKAIPGILAGVVARPPMSPYDTLVLASGKKDGASLGQEAFGENGVPVGIVSAVTDDFSRVVLFSAPGATTNGWVGHANVPLTLEGAGAGTLLATVARAADIAVGDTVFVPGPGQLPVGSVVRIDSDPLSPAVTLRIQPAANPFSLSWVTLRATGITGVSFATSTQL